MEAKDYWYNISCFYCVSRNHFAEQSGGAERSLSVCVQCLEITVRNRSTCSFRMQFFARKRVIYKINTMVILMGLLFAIPQLNDISEFLAVYGFVAGRAWSTYVYTFLIINLWYVYLFMSKILNETCVKIIFIAITCGMVRLLFYGYETDGKELLLQII